MTDLSKGIICIDGIEIKKDTTRKDILTFFSDSIAPMSGANLTYISKKVYVDNTTFLCTFRFSDTEDIISVELYPCIEYTSAKWDRTNQQEERRQFCDAWLSERLGEPDRNLCGAEYVYEHVRISCVTHFDQHNGADAGYIVVDYLC